MPLAVFVFLKIYIHVFVYTNIKYKDDGRDYVRFIEFLAIHVTFSILHSCLSYYVVYSLMDNLEAIFCNVKNISGVVYLDIPDCTIMGIKYYTWTIFAMIALATEMCIYLAYYKDVIFALITLANYVGMLVNMYYPDSDVVSL